MTAATLSFSALTAILPAYGCRGKSSGTQGWHKIKSIPSWNSKNDWIVWNGNQVARPKLNTKNKRQVLARPLREVEQARSMVKQARRSLAGLQNRRRYSLRSYQQPLIYWGFDNDSSGPNTELIERELVYFKRIWLCLFGIPNYLKRDKKYKCRKDLHSWLCCMDALPPRFCCMVWRNDNNEAQGAPDQCIPLYMPYIEAGPGRCWQRTSSVPRNCSFWVLVWWVPLLSIKVKKGDTVSKGQLLLSISDEELEPKGSELEVMIREAQTTYDFSKKKTEERLQLCCRTKQISPKEYENVLHFGKYNRWNQTGHGQADEKSF